MIYADVKIGREVTLNYNNMGSVAQYVTPFGAVRCVRSEASAEVLIKA